MAQVLVQNRVSLAQPVIPDLVQRQGINVKKQSPSTMMMVNLVSQIDPATGKPMQDDLYSQQLRHHPDQGRAGPFAGRGQRHLYRRARLQHARLARPQQDGLPGTEHQRRGPGRQRAEPAGGGRADRPGTLAARAGVPVDHQYPGPADRGRTIPQHHSQGRPGGPNGQDDRHRVTWATWPGVELRRPAIRPVVHAGRPALGGPLDLPIAGLQRHQDRPGRVRKDGRA